MISRLLKIAGQFFVRIEQPQVQSNPKWAFHGEIYIGRIRLDVREGMPFTPSPGMMIDPTHLPFCCTKLTTTVNSSSGIRAVPSHRPLSASSARESNRRSDDQDRDQPHERTARCHQLSGSQLPGSGGAFAPLKLR